MVPTTTAALAIFLAAIVPGYLTNYFWSRNKTWKGLQNDLQTIIKSITLSAVIQVLVLPYALLQLYPVRDHLDLHPYRVAGWLILTMLVLPYLLGRVAAGVTDWLFSPAAIYAAPVDHQSWTRRLQTLGRWITEPAAQPSAWDWTVTADRLDGCYVVITWKDGSQTAGTFGIGSAAFTTPERQGLYLRTEWLLDEDGDFDEAVPNSAGILIPNLDEVRSIRLLRGETPDGEEQAATEAETDTPEEGRTRLDQQSGASETTSGAKAAGTADEVS